MVDSPFNTHVRRLLESITRHGRTVLDAGCGRSAKLSVWLAEQGCDVVGVDPLLPLPRGQVIEVSDLSRGCLRLVAADLLALELLERFDVVALLGVLHYLGGPERAADLLARLARWARPGGLLAASWLVDAQPLLLEHERAWFPDHGADQLFADAGFHLLEDWCVQITHAHGGPEHTHRVRYGTWIAQPAAQTGWATR